MAMIKAFLSEYKTYKSEFEVFNYKNLGRLDKEMVNFKDRISKLKNSMQA